MSAPADYRLCYVEDSGWAWFTRKPLDEQHGDDWDDAPYEHNAGLPYEDEPGDIIRLGWIADLVTPSWGHANSPYSVDDINRHRATAWLDYPEWRAWRGERRLYAGATVPEFIEFIETAIGQVFVPREWLADAAAAGLVVGAAS